MNVVGDRSNPVVSVAEKVTVPENRLCDGEAGLGTLRPQERFEDVPFVTDFDNYREVIDRDRLEDMPDDGNSDTNKRRNSCWCSRPDAIDVGALDFSVLPRESAGVVDGTVPILVEAESCVEVTEPRV